MVHAINAINKVGDVSCGRAKHGRSQGMPPGKFLKCIL